MFRVFLLVAAVSGLVAVVLGAFAAHGLRGKIDAGLLNAFHTGVHYQMFHTLALLAVAFLLLHFPNAKLFHWSGWAFVVGILLFSGSLYMLALGGPRWLGPVTPVGGLAFIFGWILLLLGSWRLPDA